MFSFNKYISIFLVSYFLSINVIRAVNLNNSIPKGIDVTHILQKIIDEEGYLKLDSGKYFISSPLKVKKSTQIIGSGTGNTIIEPLIQMDYMITSLQNDNETSKNHKVVSGIKLQDIHLNGANKVRSGIYFVYDSNCYFENVKVTRTQIGFDIHGWSHTFIHCTSMYNVIGGMFGNAFNQVNFTGCFFNSNDVGLYVAGNAVAFNNCDIEKNDLVGCVNRSTQVSFKDCYFESNGRIGLDFLETDDGTKTSWGYFYNDSYPYIEKIQTDIILCSSLILHKNGTVRLNLSNGWLPQNTTIEKCYFNSGMKFAVVGSAAKLKIVDNVFETKYDAVYAVIPSSRNTIIKLLQIYDNYVDRDKSDGMKFVQVQPIMMLTSRNKIVDSFWKFMHYGDHKLNSQYESVDFGKNLYRFNAKLKSDGKLDPKRGMVIHSYNKNEVIYKVSMMNSDNYTFGFHSFTNDGSILTNKKALYPNTLYCFEADVKLSRELEKDEKIRMTFISSNINHAEHKVISGLNTMNYVKGSFYFYNNNNIQNDNWEATITSLSLKKDLDLYIKNPRFYNVTNRKDYSSNYFSFLKYGLRNVTKNNVPLTSGVRVGEQMFYEGCDASLNRNLVCVRTGEDGFNDVWANILFKEYNMNEVPEIIIDSHLSKIKTFGQFKDKPLESDGINIGFSYFCTDRKTRDSEENGLVIYYRGKNIWVDALGRIIK